MIALNKGLALAVTALIVAAAIYHSAPALTNLTEDSQLDLSCGFSDDFTTFLNKNGYSGYNFDRPDLRCAAFGGRASHEETLSKIPVIFIHGNSDIGFGRGTADGYVYWQTGFRDLAIYFGSQGYKKAELYTTTWGPANPSTVSNNYHSKKNVMQIRAFVEAVLAYTGAKQVNIIGHSMGVTIGRKIVKGGQSQDHIQGTYNVGKSLSDKVKSFIGLAGANLGLTGCWNLATIPTCSNVDGFNPGSFVTSGPSRFLNDLNYAGGPEGRSVYTIWSKYDDIILSQCVVWGKVTCRIPGQIQQIVKNSIDWTHFAVRDKTGPDMISWL